MEAFKKAWLNILNISGRTRRSEFFPVFIVGWFIIGCSNMVLGLFGLGLAQRVLVGLYEIVTFTLCMRRLHDAGHTCAWLLLKLLWEVPLLGWILGAIGWVVLMLLYLQDSVPDNQYGPNPKVMSRYNNTQNMGYDNTDYSNMQNNGYNSGYNNGYYGQNNYGQNNGGVNIDIGYGMGNTERTNNNNNNNIY